MKICDLTQFYSPLSGGVKRYVHEKIAFVQERDTDEHVLIIPGEKDECIAGGRSRIYTIRSPLVSRTARYRALLRLGAVEEILEREMPDIIESGDPYQVAWKAVASGRALHIPIVGFYHSHFPEAYLRSAAKFFGRTATEFVMDAARRYVCKLYNSFARTLVPSPALGDLLRTWGVENVAHIDLGVNISIFKSEPGDRFATREELGISRDRVLLLYVGRLALEKNTRTLFDAFEMLAQNQPNRFHLLAVGDGSARDFLQSLIEKTGAVTWRNYCADPAQLAQFYRAADLFVHPGVQETFGLVALESQACGTPVVGIRGSYMDRIICSHLDFWAAENSAPALASAIEMMSREDLRSIGARSSHDVTAQYSWTSVFDRLFAVYRQVVSTYKASR